MKIQPSTIFAVATLVAALSTVFVARGQQPAVAPRYEVATVKWDGPDRLQFLTPQKSESIRLFKTGVQLPPEIRDEEFCLTWAANKMALDGWEPVNLNSTRILFRRPVIR
jgi:hypothetical protein